MEDGDSGGDIHPDSGTDRNGHDIVHGRTDALVKSEGQDRMHLENKRKIVFFFVFCSVFTIFVRKT